MGNTQARAKVFGLFLSGLMAFLGIGGLWASPAFAQCDPIPGASGPDAVSVFGTDVSAVEVYGCFNGIQAYSARGGLCNVGTEGLPADTSTNHHAMMTQNLYRLTDNRAAQGGSRIGRPSPMLADEVDPRGGLRSSWPVG